MMRVRSMGWTQPQHTPGTGHVAVASPSPFTGLYTVDMLHACSHYTTHMQPTAWASEDRGGGEKVGQPSGLCPSFSPVTKFSH